MLRVLVVSDRHGPNGCLCALIRAAGDMEPLCEGGEAAAAFLCGEAFPVAVVDLRPGGEAESLLRRAAEEGCAVVDALNRGLIPLRRHESYCALWEELKEKRDREYD